MILSKMILTVDHGDFSDVVRRASDTGGQRAQAHGRRLGDDGVRDGAERQGEYKRDDDTQAGLSVRRRLVLGHGRGDTEGEEQADVDECAPEVDGAAPKVRAEEPRAADGKGLQTRVNETERKGE